MGASCGCVQPTFNRVGSSSSLDDAPRREPVSRKLSRKVMFQRNLSYRHIRHRLYGPQDNPELLPYVQAIMDATMIFSPSKKNVALPKHLVAKKVLRNENMMIYGKYATKRQQIRLCRKDEIEIVDVSTHQPAQAMQHFRSQTFGGKEVSRTLEEGINEVYLWHGTSYDAVRSIFDKDFMVAAKAHTGLFGKGLYFAESCAKADEYSSDARHVKGWYATDDSKSRIAEGSPIRGMLLCRIVLGKVKLVRESGDDGNLGDGSHDSLVAVRDGHRREFVLAHIDSVFPEFGVLYSRDRMSLISPEAA